MKINNKTVSVLYIDRQQIMLFSPEFKEAHQFKFSSEAIQDLEVLNKNALQRQLENWFEQLEFTPSLGLIVFSPQTYYHHQFAGETLEPEDPKIAQFTDTVPFDSIESKIYPVNEGAVVVAMNKHLFEPLVTVLERSGYLVMAAVPAMVTGIDFTQQQFDAKTGAQLLNSMEALSKFSFLDAETVEEKLNPKTDFMTVKIDRKVIAGAIVFVLLLVVLGVLLWTQRAQAPAPTPAVVAPPAVQAPEPVVGSPQPTATPTSENVGETQTYSLIIERGSISDSQYQVIANELGGSFNIGQEPAVSQRSARTLIIYPRDVSSASRTIINEVVGGVDPDFSTQINDSMPSNQIMIVFKTEN